MYFSNHSISITVREERSSHAERLIQQVVLRGCDGRWVELIERYTQRTLKASDTSVLAISDVDK